MQFLSGLRLSNRALLKVEGPDAALFLQGLITKDIRFVFLEFSKGFNYKIKSYFI